MIRCPSCSASIPHDSRFCNGCGAELGTATQRATATSVGDEHGGVRRSATGSPVSSTSGASLDARFAPGTMLGQRYRIIGLLGRGGMGEVYRADDLKLGQPVALKFLSEEVERDPHRLSRFLNEVRVALRVSHANVCRVYDIGELDGRHFIAMEYVDGEDLASLLRRIGRFPGDRAVQAARQLCAGLAAAHGQGILHRDLKPANVMIDGRGRVKITDFGLAGIAADIGGEEIRAGTPAYMAPEQLAGREVSRRSDIYALGLVLYELFTGRQAMPGRTPAQIARRQETSPASPSSLIDDLDPAVERVILRCLEHAPEDRPASALAVAAALPGGDPLAAALAAGETPSPELIAEAGASGGLRPRIAVALLLGVVACVALIIALSRKHTLAGCVPLETPVQVLAAKARDVIRNAGHVVPPADSVFSFEANGDYLAALQEREPAVQRFEALGDGQPAGLLFAYRESPRLLVRTHGAIGGWMDDPPPVVPGMVEVRLDTLGRLLAFSAVPPPQDVAAPPAVEPDWTPLFAAAGFDPQAFDPVAPAWLPPVFADRRFAWSGVYPDAPEVPIRIEAASHRGAPVAFRVIEPWTRGVQPATRRTAFWARASDFVAAVWFSVVMIGAGLVALRNLRLGRGDRRTALRFGLYLGGVRLLWMLCANHAASGGEIELLRAHLAWALYRFGVVYVFYLALEPYARRLWPHMLTSWVRLTGGRWRDPLVGRDLLVGALAGGLHAGIIRASAWIPELTGVANYPLATGLWSAEALRGLPRAVGALAAVHAESVLNVMTGIMMILVLRVLLRRTWPTVAISSALMVVLFNPGGGHPLPYLLAILLVLPLFWLVLFRFGLLPVLVSGTVADLLMNLPLTFDPTVWYGYVTLLVLAVVVGGAAWACWVSLAGRPLFRDEVVGAEAGAR